MVLFPNMEEKDPRRNWLAKYHLENMTVKWKK